MQEEEGEVADNDDDVFCYAAAKVEFRRPRRALALKRDRQSSGDSNGFVVVVAASVNLEVKTLVRRRKWS